MGFAWFGTIVHLLWFNVYLHVKVYLLKKHVPHIFLTKNNRKSMQLWFF